MFENLKLYDSDKNEVFSYTQWDNGQTMYVRNADLSLTTAPTIHICNKNSKEALAVKSNITIDNYIQFNIPTILFQEPFPIFIYIYKNTEDSDRTICLGRVLVRKKIKPIDYIYSDTLSNLAFERIDALVSQLFFEKVDTVYERISYLSEMTPTFTFGKVCTNTNINGNKLRIQDKDGRIVQFDKGISMSFYSQIVYQILPGEFDYLETWIGVDNESPSSEKNTVFALYSKEHENDSWTRLYGLTREPEFVFGKWSVATWLTIPLPDTAAYICLEILKKDGSAEEGGHADWADAKFVKKKSLPENTLTGLLEALRQGKADNTHTHELILGHSVKSDVPENAKFTDTVYIHPVSHPAAIITTDTTHRFVTDAEKALWNGKAGSADPVFTGSFSQNRKSGSTIGKNSHTEGWNNIASGDYSHASGCETEALHFQMAIGRYNDTATAKSGAALGTVGTLFVIGNGTDTSNLSNAFRVTESGQTIGTLAYSTTGADYAEFFEWKDGNQKREDRIGHFVTLESEGNIRFANEDEYVLGIVSGCPAVIGNYDECWQGRNAKDVFGRYLYEEAEIADAQGNVQTGIVLKKNPEYNPKQQYIPRSERPEWDTIGLLGVLTVYDDGTCQEGGYCKCTDGGIAAIAETGYKVIKRMNDNIIEIVLK